MNLARTVQIALLGEVPPTLRFIYSHLENNRLHYHAVFDDEASEDHLECASVVLTEILAACSPDVELDEKIERNSSIPWRVGSGEHLLFLRYGELSGT